MVWFGGTELERPPLSAILPRLYLGAESDVTQERLSSLDISYVLSVSRCSPRPTFLPCSRFLRVPIDDSLSADLLPWIPQALSFIDSARSSGASVLVHCAAGISRSPALTVAYIMHCLDLDLDHAYRFVKERRPSISPNLNFLGQLQHFQSTLKPGTPPFVAPEEATPLKCVGAPQDLSTNTPPAPTHHNPGHWDPTAHSGAPQGAPSAGTLDIPKHRLPKALSLNLSEHFLQTESRCVSIREKRKSLTLSLTPLNQGPPSVSPGPDISETTPVRAQTKQPRTDIHPTQLVDQDRGPRADHKEALLSPLSLTLNRLLSWGERWLLATPVRMGQPPLPYGC